MIAALLLAGAAAAAPLRWGADQSGGGPYVYEGEDGRLTGFEVELAGFLAAELGREPVFVQGQWDKLPQLLDRGDLDMVLNGYEWTEERASCWDATVPYYVYGLQLLARADGPVRSWEDLRGRKIGVLSGSAAQRLAEERLGSSAEILAFDGVTNAMRLVEQGQIDATIQDTPIAAFYLKEFPGLARVGLPQAPGAYVILVRKGETGLKEALDHAIRKALSDGTLRALYGKYGLWDAAQEGLPGFRPGTAAPADPRGFRERFGGLLLSGAWMTLKLSCLAMPLAMVLGLLVALGRLYGPKWLGWPLEAYVEVLRGTPVLLQLFVLYYVLPNLLPQLKGLDAFWTGVIGLGINYSAYEAENYRAGLLAVPKGQMEAALALGMRPGTALRRVIVPQAVRIVIPPVTNDFIALFKDTSVCSVIAVSELTGVSNRLFNNHPRLALELGLATAVLYLLMSYPLALLARRLEQRLKGVHA